MRRVLCVVAIVLFGTNWTAAGQMGGGVVPVSPQGRVIWNATDSRIEHMRQWLWAVDRHEPGVQDDPVLEVGKWSNIELRGLWADLSVLSQLMRKLGQNRFLIRSEKPRGTTEIRYTPFQIRQMRVFACAAAGVHSRQDCLDLPGAGAGWDDNLLRLAQHAAAERSRSGDDNYLVRRVALLHADIAMIQPPKTVEPFVGRSAAAAIGPQTWRIDIADGRDLNAGLSALHWDIARLALDQVKSGSSAMPTPERDGMVRAWYRATAAWMQYREDHDTQHLDHARAIFPEDPDLLFLSGCQRETFASPAIQAAARSAARSLPLDFTVAIESDRSELRRAEAFFKSAVAKQPDMGEIHLRLGHVLGLEGHHADAVTEIRRAMTLLTDEQLLYYGELFLGGEEEASGRFDAAHDAFERAAARFPSAQSPLVALSELARRRGDRSGALAAIQKVFALPPAGQADREDPWWSYHTAQARNADSLLDAMRAPFRRERP